MTSKTMALGLMVVGGLSAIALTGCGRTAAAGPRAQTEVALDIRKALEAGSPEVGAAAASEPTGTGWGTLSGTFKYAGKPPTPGMLTIDKDTEVCGKGKGIQDNSLLVASDGGIANIVLYARVKRVHESAQPLEGDNAPEVIFDQKGCMFLTHVLAFQLGAKVGIKNSDPIGHNTKVDPSKGTPVNQTLAADSAPMDYRASAEEAVPATVSCSIHPWMRAYLLPRKDKYFAVTKPDGSFEIANLPAGEDVEIQVWHERASGPGHALVLDNKELKWSPKGRFKVTLDVDQTKSLALEVPATAFQ
jgi:hypothetical protein